MNDTLLRYEHTNLRDCYGMRVLFLAVEDAPRQFQPQDEEDGLDVSALSRHAESY